MNVNLLADKDFIVFSTREYAHAGNLSIAAASKQLKRRANDGLITPVTRGLWANTRHPAFNPLACVSHLLNMEQGYVSFLTALHRHGMISQIPSSIQIATTGHSRKLTTAVGAFEFLQLKPELMRHGIEWSGNPLPYRMATAEKALIDTFYIATRKRRRFAVLPELDFAAASFSKKKFRHLLDQLELTAPIKTAMEMRFAKIRSV